MILKNMKNAVRSRVRGKGAGAPQATNLNLQEKLDVSRRRDAFDIERYNPSVDKGARVPLLIPYLGRPSYRNIGPTGDAGMPEVWTTRIRGILARVTKELTIAGVADANGSLVLELNAGGNGAADVDVFGIQLAINKPRNATKGDDDTTFTMTGLDSDTAAPIATPPFFTVIAGELNTVSFVNFGKPNVDDFSRGTPLIVRARAADAANKLTFTFTAQPDTRVRVTTLVGANRDYAAVLRDLGLKA